MATSIFLAKLIGPIALVMGLALTFNAAVYRTMANEFLHSNALIFLAGLITLTAGLAIVLVHNVWAADWRVVITVLGWLFIVSGIIRTGVPQRVTTIGRTLLAKPLTMKIGAAIDLALGALLCFYGYLR
jgi:4-amino-4-deoxy-L-arabinose transferase-like glycosyltransferase